MRRGSILGLLLLVHSIAPLWAQEKNLPVTGVEDPRLAAFDRMMIRFMEEDKIPGAALAISKDGRLVYARGFGYADVDSKTAVQPTSLFRIASVSKPITATAVLHLVDRGKLRLEDRPFELLGLKPHLEKGARIDPRLNRITVRELLNHTGGFDRDKSFDPMFDSIEIARALGEPPPAKPNAIIRYTMGRRLDFDPGKRYAYSNFGYCVLGRVIEHAGKQPYEQYVREQILEPINIRSMRIGHSLAAQRVPGEVKYYASGTTPAVVGAIGKPVPPPYGGWYLEAMDSHGGWIASAIDLVRFADTLNDPARCPLLKPKTWQTMFAPPPGEVGHLKDGKPRDSYYACGWDVVRLDKTGQFNAFHTGGLDGTSTLLVRRADGLNWAVLFNTSNAGNKKPPADVIDPLVHRAADQVKDWPKKDLYPKR
jgi:N-acyl-D-amino-acid deacylase